MKKIFLLSFILLLIVTKTMAAPNNNMAPVEISADSGLEWNRDDKIYTAIDNVIVKQGKTEIKSDKLTAHYIEDNGSINITKLIARGNVVISSFPYKAYGDKAVYDTHNGNATLTGRHLKMTANGDTLTARDRIEFSTKKNRLVATGKAKIKHGSETVTADILRTYFNKNINGKMTITKVTAHGNITLKTPKETITGDEGVYNISTQTAVMSGKVKIMRGQSWLEGKQAKVDMLTGISNLLGGKETDKKTRVKGIFYPKKKGP